MRKFLKNTALIALALLGALLLALLSIGTGPFNRFIEQQIISVAQRQGIRLALRETSVGIRHLTARSGEVFLPQAFFLLPFQELDVEPHWRGLLSGEPGVTMQALLAGGSGSLYLHGSADGGVTFDSSLKQLKLQEIAQFAAFGFTSGTLNMESRKVSVNGNRISSGDVELRIERIEKPHPSRLPITVGNFPLTIEIPPIGDGRVNAKLSASPGTITISRLESLSSWGTISAGGTLGVDNQGHIRQVALKGDVHLAAAGQSSFRSYLPLISQGKLKAESSSFSFEVSGIPPALKTTFVDRS